MVVNTTYAECDKYFMFYTPAKDYVKLEKMDGGTFIAAMSTIRKHSVQLRGAEKPGWVAPRSAH